MIIPAVKRRFSVVARCNDGVAVDRRPLFEGSQNRPGIFF